jgi:hypothetical protein
MTPMQRLAAMQKSIQEQETMLKEAEEAAGIPRLMDQLFERRAEYAV